MFTNATGEHLNIVTLYKQFKQIAAQIGAPEARIHDLRHTFEVISLQNGDDFKTVQDALGHEQQRSRLTFTAMFPRE